MIKAAGQIMPFIAAPRWLAGSRSGPDHWRGDALDHDVDARGLAARQRPFDRARQFVRRSAPVRRGRPAPPPPSHIASAAARSQTSDWARNRAPADCTRRSIVHRCRLSRRTADCSRTAVSNSAMWKPNVPSPSTTNTGASRSTTRAAHAIGSDEPIEPHTPLIRRRGDHRQHALSPLRELAAVADQHRVGVLPDVWLERAEHLHRMQLARRLRRERHPRPRAGR